MAERASRGRDGAASTRRLSLRRSLACAELSDADVQRLEAKRRQLDESIHRYIASKEREYKALERELIQQRQRGIAGESEAPRAPRTWPRATQHAPSPPALDAVDASHPAHRRASLERDKDFIGLFTPAFLPALYVKSASPAHRAGEERQADGVPRAVSDTAVRARPERLHLSGRTSSSLSSADGNAKLPSALRSPTHQPRKKRVSLAVGDSIVAPSDNVPITTHPHNSIPFHSRTRSPASAKRSNGQAAPTSDPVPSVLPAEPATAPFLPSAPPAMTSQSNKAEQAQQNPQEEPTASSSLAPVITSSTPTSRTNVDSDLDFGLGTDEVPLDQAVEDGSQDSEDEVAGRVTRPATSPCDDHLTRGSSEAFMLEAAEESDDHAQHMQFRPSSVQQSTTPGFGRPSATVDPVYRGSDYARAEHSAVTNEIYGSSFNRPSSKGSFTAGSLGEGFMAQNAQQLMRNRAASKDT